MLNKLLNRLFNKSLVTKEDRDIIKKLNYLKLVTIADKLNSWEWPEELPNEETVKDYKPNRRRSQLRVYIEGIVGKELILRKHNEKSMTEEEFYDFYAASFHSNEAAELRYNKRINIRLGINEEINNV